ncbi:MAG TPA: hypothetical protein VGW38_24010 [Chloroflexota bacterium]|nr:hypothetical protein [Chloroflexota bacterium]
MIAPPDVLDGSGPTVASEPAALSNGTDSGFFLSLFRRPALWRLLEWMPPNT